MKLPFRNRLLRAAERSSSRTLQRALSRSGSEFVRAALATNELLTDTVVSALTGDPSVLVRRRLASNGALPAQACHALAADPSSLVRSRLVVNDALTSSRAAQALLAQDESFSVISLLAERVTDPALQEELRVRGGLELILARNPHLTTPVYMALVGDDDPTLRRTLASRFRRHVPDHLHEDLVVEFLELSVAGRAYLARHLSDLDPSTRDALAEGWTGTLGELRATVLNLSPEPYRTSSMSVTTPSATQAPSVSTSPR